MSMETLQWTLLVGLIAMLIFVLWQRMKASMTRGQAPLVKADWHQEGWRVAEGRWVFLVDVKAQVELSLVLDSQRGERVVVHQGLCKAGVQRFDVGAEPGGGWVATLECPGHRSERFHPV